MPVRRFLLVASLGAVSLLAGCSDDPQPAPSACAVDTQAGCAQGQVCEETASGAPGCFAPLYVEGRVLKSAAPSEGVAGARVVARDVNGALASPDIAVSQADGSFRLRFPARRAEGGAPAVGAFALRADASGYATFPSGVRIALPVDVGAPAKQADGAYVIKNGTTDIALDALPGDPAGRGTISGTIRATSPGGALVVAGGASGIAAADGSFAVFNVPVGAQEVRGYRQGLQLTPAQATVAAGAETKGVDLLAGTAPLAVVSGDVSFVNAGSSTTTVVLVVKSTFNAALQRGEVPRGLRAAPVTGRWELKDVPAGQYVVLAAFENDGLVRDPDTSIGGTALQEIDVSSGAVSAGAFKITGALDVISPGASGPEVVTGTPAFRWKDDSSEDGYHLVVYDTFGKVVHEVKDVPRVTGAGDVSATGPAGLAPGYYQFRAFSWRSKGGSRTYISGTEDLKGVFIVR